MWVPQRKNCKVIYGILLHSPLYVKLPTMRLLYLAICSLLYVGLSGQTVEKFVLSSAGTMSQNQDLQLDWSLGQVVSGTQESGPIQINHGFHQTYIVSNPVFHWTAEDIHIQVFPNPASDFLTITHDQSQLLLEIRDLQGRLLSQKFISDNEESLDLSSLPAQTLLLTLHNEKVRKGFKILKVN